MKIKLLSREITYKRVVTNFDFVINGKKINATWTALQDDYAEYDSDFDINQAEDLTDEELEILNDNMEKLISLKKGETLIIK